MIAFILLRTVQELYLDIVVSGFVWDIEAHKSHWKNTDNKFIDMQNQALVAIVALALFTNPLAITATNKTALNAAMR